MSCCNGSPVSSPSKVVPEACSDGEANFDVAGSKTRSHIITVVHVVLEASIEKADKALSSDLHSRDEAWHIRDSPTSPTRELKRASNRNSANRLSKVVEESESFSQREAADLLSFKPQFHAADSYKHCPQKLAYESLKSLSCPKQDSSGSVHKLTAKRSSKSRSLSSIVSWPFRKLRDRYVGCMMSIDGTGDFTGIVQAGHCGSSATFFQEPPLSKADAINYG